MHNNYHIRKDETRKITSGFHLQNDEPWTMAMILKYIDGYDWRKHLEKVHKPEAKAEELREPAEKSIWQRLWDGIKNMFGRE